MRRETIAMGAHIIWRRGDQWHFSSARL